jgi:histidinol-phosphate aminotransferase
MKEFWSSRIAHITPYVPGEQPRNQTFIKLNTNENPYPPSPMALQAMADALGPDLRLYPDPECMELRKAAAAYHGLDISQVFAGNGSDEILAFCFQAFFEPDLEVVMPDISYGFYPIYADYFGIKTRLVPLDDHFDLPLAEFASAAGGVVIANPNAPTGKALGLDSVQRILNTNRNVVVIVDEAYVDFGGQSAMVLIKDYPNLLIVKTLSKSRSLAGLRVGFAMGNPNLVSALCCVRDSINSYTVDRIAQAGAIAAVKDESYFHSTRLAVMKTREETIKKMTKLGFTVTESCANFIFASHPKLSAKSLQNGLREKGILVRWFNKPRIDNYLRISIGTDAEMDALCIALKELLA